MYSENLKHMDTQSQPLRLFICDTAFFMLLFGIFTFYSLSTILTEMFKCNVMKITFMNFRLHS